MLELRGCSKSIPSRVFLHVSKTNLETFAIQFDRDRSYFGWWSKIEVTQGLGLSRYMMIFPRFLRRTHEPGDHGSCDQAFTHGIASPTVRSRGDLADRSGSAKEIDW